MFQILKNLFRDGWNKTQIFLKIKLKRSRPQRDLSKSIHAEIWKSEFELLMWQIRVFWLNSGKKGWDI